MNHEELFVCVSVVTIISFFNLTVEIGNQGVKKSLHSPESCESADRNEYKSPLYKLWQYVTKNKPSLHNSGAFYSNRKKCSLIRWVSASYLYSSKGFRQSGNYIRQLASKAILRRLLFKSSFPFCKHDDYSTGFYFVPHVYPIGQILAYVKSQIYDRNRYSKLGNFTVRIYRDAVEQQPKRSCRLSIYINRIFHHRVCCS